MKKPFKIPRLLAPVLLFSILGALLFNWVQFQKVEVKKNIQQLLHSLKDTVENAPIVGFHQSDDNATFTIQQIKDVDANGARIWSPVLHVYHYDSAKREVQLGTPDLSTLDLPQNLSSPTDLTSDQVQQVRQRVQSSNGFKSITQNVAFFSVQQTGSNTIEVKVQSSVPFSENEVVESKRKYFLPSLDL